ncbi:hypothetical protein BS78_05G096200 [Paspalum vaginatum]|nr:hypothetical protein BS78_05G096200 [Paspalum vaginatum]
MALLTAAVCSKKTNTLIIAVSLLMALHAAAVAVSAAGRASGSFPLAGENCSKVGACSDKLCTEKCGRRHFIGTCRFQGKFVNCCCRRRPASSSSNSTDSHQLVH